MRRPQSFAGAHRPPHPLAGQRRHRVAGRAGAAAAAAGLDVVALTDHDTAEGWAEAGAPRARSASTWSAAWRSAPATTATGVHLLAYLPDPAYPPLVAALAWSSTAGPPASRRCSSGCAGWASRSSTRTYAAWRRRGRHRAAARRRRAHRPRRGRVTGRRRSRRYLTTRAGRRTPTATPPRSRDGASSRRPGASAVIAHPWGRHGRTAPTRRARRPRRQLAWPASRSTTRTTTQATRERLRAIARNLGLVVTGSSDYHGTGQGRPRAGLQHHRPGRVPPPARPRRRAAAAPAAARGAVPTAGSIAGRGYFRPDGLEPLEHPVGHHPGARGDRLVLAPGIEITRPLSKSASALATSTSASSHRNAGAAADVHPLVELGLGEAGAQRRHGDARGAVLVGAHSPKLFTYALAAP